MAMSLCGPCCHGGATAAVVAGLFSLVAVAVSQVCLNKFPFPIYPADPSPFPPEPLLPHPPRDSLASTSPPLPIRSAVLPSKRPHPLPLPGSTASVSPPTGSGHLRLVCSTPSFRFHLRRRSSFAAVYISTADPQYPRCRSSDIGLMCCSLMVVPTALAPAASSSSLNASETPRRLHPSSSADPRRPCSSSFMVIPSSSSPPGERLRGPSSTSGDDSRRRAMVAAVQLQD